LINLALDIVQWRAFDSVVMNFGLDLWEIGRDGRDWIELAQDRNQWMALMNTVMNLRVP
jgi:hypothetical protein